MEFLLAIFLFISFYKQTVFSAKPCEEYLTINDSSSTVAYTAEDDANHCQNFTPFQWYRFTGTPEGYMTNTCPTGRQCGTGTQIWFNDSVPTVEEKETLKKVCVHNGTYCCIAQNRVKTINCTNFIVYFLVPVPACFRFCFDGPKQVIPKLKESPNLLVVWICLGVLIVVILLLVVFIMLCRRSRQFGGFNRPTSKASDVVQSL